jgi:hypothetical protein
MEQRRPKSRASVDISGSIRTVQVGGKWYVVGGDVLIPARDEAEAIAVAAELTSKGFPAAIDEKDDE